MSKKHDFVPRKQEDRRTNGKTFKEQAAADGTSFGLSAGEVTDIGAKWDGLDKGMTDSAAIDALKQAQTQITTAADNAFAKAWRTLAGKMKKHDDYDTSVGERYKIIGDGVSIDINTAKPVLELSKAPTGWKIDFNLLGFFDGVKIYRKRPTDPSFTYLATDTSAPYIDTDAQVNGTQYYAYFLMGDDAVGVVSDTITAQV